MAHALSVTDGTNTVDLTTTNRVREYEQANIDPAKGGLDGEPEITETLTVTLKATTGPLLQNAVHGLEALLIAAKRRNDPTSPQYKVGPRIYLMLQVDGEASAWRAEILMGDFKPDKDMLKIGWPNLQATGALLVTHRVWEGPEVELHLSTSIAAYATGGQTIYNHDDSGSGHDNCVQVQPSDVTNGVLSTPVKLVLTNTSGSSINFRNFYLACNAFSDPVNFAHIVEGESRVSGYGTITADSNSSGGNYNLYSFTTTGEIHWTLTAAQMQRTQGRRFRLLARMFGWSGTNLYVKAILKSATGNTPLYSDNDEILLGTFGSQFLDLGSLPLPAGGYQTAWGDVRLVLQVRCTGVGTFHVDFIQLTPLDSYQRVVQLGDPIANGDSITFDNIDHVFYTSSTPIYAPLDGQLRVFPNVTQKLFVLSDEGSSSNIARTWSVRAYIRERRLTV